MDQYKDEDNFCSKDQENISKSTENETSEEGFHYFLNEIIQFLNSSNSHNDYRPIIYFSDYIDKQSISQLEDLEVFNIIMQSSILYQNQIYHLEFFNKFFEYAAPDILDEIPDDFFQNYIPQTMMNSTDVEIKKIVCSIYIFACCKNTNLQKKLLEPDFVDYFLNELKNAIQYATLQQRNNNEIELKYQQYMSALIFLIEEFVKNEEVFPNIIYIFQEPELIINNLLLYAAKSAPAVMSLINTALIVTSCEYHPIFLTNEIINLIISQLFCAEIYQIASLEVLNTISSKYPIVLLNTLFNDITLIPENITPRCFVKICIIVCNIISFQCPDFIYKILESPIFSLMLTLVINAPFVVQKEVARMVSIIIQTDDNKVIKGLLENFDALIPLLKDVLEHEGDHTLTVALAFYSLFKFAQGNELSWSEQDEFIEAVFDEKTVDLLQSIDDVPESIQEMFDQIFSYLEERKL